MSSYFFVDLQKIFDKMQMKEILLGVFQLLSMGQKIKKARKAKGYSMEKLGSFIGVTKATIYKYEIDEITNLKRSTIAEIAKVLEVDPLWLMGWDDDDDVDPEEFLRTHVRREEDQELIEDLTYIFNQFSELPEVKLMRMQIQTLYQLYVGVNEEK